LNNTIEEYFISDKSKRETLNAIIERKVIVLIKVFMPAVRDRIYKWEVPEMKQAIGAYRKVTATDEFKEIERLRSRARYNEASALGKARREEREKWQGVVAEKDAEIATLRAQLAEKK